LEITSVKKNTWDSRSLVSWLKTLWVFNSLDQTFAASKETPKLSFAPDGMLLDLFIRSLETTIVLTLLPKSHTDGLTSMRTALSILIS
jgi:hypothetical protein